jgi:uncharacterized protein YndB with AHSA1/START domain
MIMKILIVIVAVIAAILIFAATRPNSFHVERSITIHAPADKIFPLINNLQAWESWAPDDRKDPTTKTTYSGPASGVGAVSEWDGKGSGGKGRAQIRESVPARKVSVMVDFVRPFEAHNLNEFKLEPQPAGPGGEATKVTWSIDASNLYAMKLVGVFFNIQREFGKHIDQGLGNLKSVAEK